MPDPIGDDFLSEITAAFIAQHEMFKHYVAAGFTEDQALKLVALVAVEAGKMHNEKMQGGQS